MLASSLRTSADSSCPPDTCPPRHTQLPRHEGGTRQNTSTLLATIILILVKVPGVTNISYICSGPAAIAHSHITEDNPSAVTTSFLYPQACAQQMLRALCSLEQTVGTLGVILRLLRTCRTCIHDTWKPHARSQSKRRVEYASQELERS